MKIFLVVLIAAVASARRPPRGFDIDYSDSPPFFDSPPPSSRPSFLSPFPRHHPYPRVLQSFSDDTSIISDEPPSFREEEIIYGSMPPSSYYPRRPHSFYKSGPSSFAQELSILDEYRGPPPPAPNKDPRKQTSVTRDERPSIAAAALLQLPTTMADEQESYKSAEQPIRQEIPTRQPLSFGGHSNHLSYGNHGLGFASVAGATSAHLDPLAIAEMTTASTTTTTTPSPSSPSEVQVSQQQPVTNTPKPSETPTSAEPKVISTATQPSTTKTASTPSDSASTASTASSTSTTATVTSVTPKTHLDLARTSPSQTTKAVPMMSQEPLRMSYEFRTVTQELPAASHGQLPLESPRPEPSHVLDIKQNLLQEENKANFPYQQFDYQFHQQNSNNAAPLRFTIPTATFSTAPLSAASATAAAAVLPAKPHVTQGLSFPQMPLALAAVPNSNTYPIGQNQIDISQLGQFSSINMAPQLPSYYYAQNTEQMKTPLQISSNIPLASFYMLPNNAQPSQPMQINPGVQSGIPLQFNGFGGIELLSSSSNSVPTRSDILGLERAGFNIQQQGQLQSSEPTLARIGFGQNIW